MSEMQTGGGGGGSICCDDGTSGNKHNLGRKIRPEEVGELQNNRRGG